jgi:pimeloyl-ACP methyl ester carboxylesterase
MATFLLVHGAWHGGWCYRRVERLLQGRGHVVLAPTLTGLGDRSHQFRSNLNLEDHVTDILAVIHYEELDDFVLVGHSYGGCVISAVADRVPERIRTLVYLDAFVPTDGKCIMDYMPAKLNEVLRSQAAAQEGGVPPLPAATLGVNDADVALVDRLCVNQPIGTFQQPVHYTGGIDHLGGRKVFILATKFENPTFGHFYTEREGDPSWKTYTINSGHDMMLDEPERLADILEEVAG